MTIHSAQSCFSSTLEMLLSNLQTLQQLHTSVWWCYIGSFVCLELDFCWSVVFICLVLFWLFVVFWFFWVFGATVVGVLWGFLNYIKNQYRNLPTSMVKAAVKDSWMLSPHQAEIGNHLLKWPIIKHNHCFAQAQHSVRQRASPLLDLFYPSTSLFRKQITFLRF